MIQSFDTQLQVSLRALRDTIGPAVANSESHVVEQLNLAIATLEFTRQRLPFGRRYHRLELNQLLGMTGVIRRLIGQDQPTLKQAIAGKEAVAEKLLADPEAEIEDYIQIGRDLRERIKQAIAQSEGKTYEAALDTLVVEQQQALLTMQRVWCAPLGLDSAVSTMPTLDQLLR